MSKTVEEVVANQTKIDSVPTHQKGRLLFPLYDRVRLAQKLFLKIRRDYLDMGSFPETVAADW